MRLLLKIPFIGRRIRRRQLAAQLAVWHAEQRAFRHQAAEHNAAVARIFAQAAYTPDRRNRR